MDGISGLRREVFAAISWHMHRGDETPRDTIDRLVLKATDEDITGMGLLFDEQTYRISDLVKFQGKNHGARKPRFSSGPIILFQSKSSMFILDGQNRINRYLAKGASHRKHRCLILSAGG